MVTEGQMKRERDGNLGIGRPRFTIDHGQKKTTLGWSLFPKSFLALEVCLQWTLSWIYTSFVSDIVMVVMCLKRSIDTHKIPKTYLSKTSYVPDIKSKRLHIFVFEHDLDMLIILR